MMCSTLCQAKDRVLYVGKKIGKHVGMEEGHYKEVRSEIKEMEKVKDI